MNTVTTVSTKGQVVIPQLFRQTLGLKPNDKLAFKLEGKRLVAEKVASVEDFLGFVPAKRRLTKNEMKQIIIGGVRNKLK